MPAPDGPAEAMLLVVRLAVRTLLIKESAPACAGDERRTTIETAALAIMRSRGATPLC